MASSTIIATTTAAASESSINTTQVPFCTSTTSIAAPGPFLSTAGPPSSTTSAASINYGFKLIAILIGSGRRVMHTVFLWGTPLKPPEMDLITYLSNLPPTSTANFLIATSNERKFNRIQKQQMESSTNGETFDITMLTAVIKLACENVARLNDPAWSSTGTQLENLLYMLKQQRNEVMHGQLAMTENEFVERAGTLLQLLTDTLTSAHQRYIRDNTDLTEEIRKVTDDIDRIMNEPFGMDDILINYGPALLQEFLEDALIHLKAIMKKDTLMDPMSFLIGSSIRLDVQKIFTRIKVCDGIRYDEIDYGNLLTLIQQGASSHREESSAKESSPQHQALSQRQGTTGVLSRRQGTTRVLSQRQGTTGALSWRQGSSFMQAESSHQEDEVSQQGEPFRPQILLVDALAGGGKTTLVTLLISEWLSSGQSTFHGLDTYQLLLRVQCRNSHLTSLTDLLEDLLLPLRFKYGNLMPRLVKLCRLLIIVDGLDERNRNSRELVKDLLEQFQEVPGCTFVCTTRPEALQDFRLAVPTAYKVTHVQLVGIPANLRADFVRRYFSEIIRVTNLQESSTSTSQTSVLGTKTSVSVIHTSVQQPSASASVQQPVTSTIFQQPSSSVQHPSSSIPIQQQSISPSVQQTSAPAVSQQASSESVHQLMAGDKSIPNIYDLVEKVEKEKYKEHLRLPLNLTMLTWMFFLDPTTINKTTTQAELCDLTHQLCQDKLEQRLANHESTKLMNRRSRLCKVKEWLPHLYMMEFEALSLDQITLLEEAADQLIIECDSLDLPHDEVMAAFLSMRTTYTARGVLQQYQVPHKGFQDYYAAMHIGLKLIMQQNQPSIHSVQEKFAQFWRGRRFLQFWKSKNSIKEVMKQSLGTADLSLAKFQNSLQQLAGLLHLHLNPIPEKLAIDVVELLYQTGVKDRDQWLDVLEDTMTAPAVLKAIAAIFPSDGIIEVVDGRVHSYLLLLPLLQRSHVSVDLHSNSVSLLPCLVRHTCISLQLWHQYHHPYQTTLLPDHIMEQVFSSGGVERFAGHLNPGPATKLPSSIRELHVVLHSDAQAAVVPCLHRFKNLKKLSIHLASRVNMASLTPLPDLKRPNIKGRYLTGVDLYVSDVGEGMMDEVVSKIAKLSPKSGYKTLNFPRASLGVEGWKELLDALNHRRVRVRSSIEVCPSAITEERTFHMSKYAKFMVGCEMTRMEEYRHALWE